MGTRNKLFQTDETRKKIQTSQIINRLSDHIDGKNQLTNTQIRAAEILLRKSLPDLSSIELSGDPENPLEHNVVLRPTITREEWLKSIGHD